MKKRGKQKRRRPNLFPEDATLGIMGGVGLAYFVLVAHPFGHPVHWLYTGIGGLVGYLAVLLWANRPSGMRTLTGRWLWFYRGSASLLVAAFITIFILIGYVFPER